MKKFFLVILFSFFLISCIPEHEEGNNTSTGSFDVSNITKKTFVGFVATWCPHCNDEMPIIDKFYRENKSEVNMQMIVIDGEKMDGNYEVPQDLSNPVTYEDLTKEQCDYIPSYVIYDENKNIIDKKCGSKLTYEELETKLLGKDDSLTNLNSNTNTDMENNTSTGETTKNIDNSEDREVKAGDKIAVNYVGKTADDEEEFDNSYTRGTPLEFKVGAGTMIAGFDSGVLGMKIGDKKTLNIKAADAYGDYDEKNIQEVKKEELQQFVDAGYELKEGVKLPTMYGEIEVKEILEDAVMLDLNHFLAGKDLIFEVEMVEFKN